MEDEFGVAYQQTSDEKDLEYAFFGIFDGHGGREAALFAKVSRFQWVGIGNNSVKEGWDQEKILQFFYNLKQECVGAIQDLGVS